MAMKQGEGYSRNQSGQAVIEYILLLAIVVGFYFIIWEGIRGLRLERKLMKPLSEDFAAAYRYGHPKAKGFDDGGPYYHPRAIGGQRNFRIFLNRTSQR